MEEILSTMIDFKSDSYSHIVTLQCHFFKLCNIRHARFHLDKNNQELFLWSINRLSTTHFFSLKSMVTKPRTSTVKSETTLRSFRKTWCFDWPKTNWISSWSAKKHLKLGRGTLSSVCLHRTIHIHAFPSKKKESFIGSIFWLFFHMLFTTSSLKWCKNK